MIIKDIMKHPVITISKDAALREAVASLSSTGVSGLPVVDDKGNLIGIVTEHDIIKTMLPTYLDVLSSDEALLDPDLMQARGYEVRDIPVGDIMTGNVVSLEEDDSILKAATIMTIKRIKRLPVVKDGKPVGIVSRINVLDAVMRGALQGGNNVG